METKVNYTAVGMFVIGLGIAFTLGIIWLSSGFHGEQHSRYIVYMKESVAGVNVDSPVEFNGVAVGEVRSIKLNKNNPKLVELILDIKQSTPITQGTVATLATRGVTGITYVSLQDVGDNIAPLVKKSGDKYPVIQTAPSLFVRLDTALTSLSTNLSAAAKSIESILNDDNQKSLKGILFNLSELTEMLAKNNTKMTEILSNTEKASQDLTPFLQSSREVMQILEAQTLPATYRMMNDLSTMTRNLAALSGELKENPSMLVRGRAEGTLGPGEGK